MSSLPPRQPEANPHTLSSAAHIQQATQKVNRFAKRDPSLYPLSFIVIGALATAGYFATKKTTEPPAHRQLMQNGVVNPWDDVKTHDTHPSQFAAFKYRHKTRDGHYEDSFPTLTQDVRTLKDAAKHKFSTN